MRVKNVSGCANCPFFKEVPHAAFCLHPDSQSPHFGELTEETRAALMRCPPICPKNEVLVVFESDVVLGTF